MIGDILNEKYRIVEQIGTGGMACVYKAVQLASPHRTVAIKLLKEEYEQDAAFLRRFETEAQAVLVLSHENIVRSFDVGQDGDRHYIVLEYVEGETLKDRIRAHGRLATRHAINIGAQVLDALSHAHNRGIIHRDVKPQNIIINNRGRVKLADFGIARIADIDNTITFAGPSILGSVHYFSPEQAKGASTTVESDIYSMGVALYEMVTGSVPFEGETSVTIGLKHLQEEPVPPIERNPTLPPAFNDIILRAMSKQPQARYASALDMRRDLMRVLREPTGTFARLAPAVSDAPPKKKKKRRASRLARIALTAVLIIALFSALLLAGISLLRERDLDNADLVPTLVNKLLSEAEHTASLRGYKVEVVNRVYSYEIEKNFVISQTPEASARLAPGSTIEVVVSLGTGDAVSAPDLTGLTLTEAELALAEVGLRLGTVEYITSEVAAGCVCDQDPLPSESVLRNEAVNVLVSGTPLRAIQTPDILHLPLSEALVRLTESGFSLFRVRRAEPGVEPDRIVSQSPAQGDTLSGDAYFYLTVAEDTPSYAANVVVPFGGPLQEGNTFMAALSLESDGIPYQLVVYETPITGKNITSLEFEARHNMKGNFELILYLNNVEVGRNTVAFKRNA